MNILLEKLPTKYKGYKINTDFRVGIKLCGIMENMQRSESEDALDEAIDLLWGNGVPTTLSEDGEIVVDYDLIWETLTWFKLGGNPEFAIRRAKRMPTKQESELSEDVAYDFEEDSGYIYAAFMQQYGIDLTEIEMHWFKFLALFHALTNTVFNRIQEIRTQDLSDVPSGKPRAAAAKAKNQWRVTNVPPEREAELRAVFGDEWEEHI